MGKRFWVQRKGSGFPHEQNSSIAERRSKYRKFPKNAPSTTAIVKDLLHDAGRGAPIAQIQFEDGKKWLYLAPEGLFIGDTITFADSGEIKVGNVFKLENVPDGSYVFNIEQEPNDGGRYIRGSGTTDCN
jgi:large subunit ribosomal protein L2